MTSKEDAARLGGARSPPARAPGSGRKGTSTMRCHPRSFRTERATDGTPARSDRFRSPPKGHAATRRSASRERGSSYRRCRDACRRAGVRPPASWPVLGGLVAGNGLLNILERRKQLLGIKLFRATAELRAVRLALQMPQAVHLRQRLVALGDRAVADRLLARTEDENRSRERIVPELL